MKNPARISRSHQDGVIFLALVLVLMVTGSALTIGALNNRQTASLERNREVRYQMEQAKAALLAYAANYASFHTDRGPGFFPCPDTDDPTAIPPVDGDGLPNYTGDVMDEQCSYDAAPALGRLPQQEIFDDTTFRINDTYADVDRQFWYVVAPRYLYSDTALNLRSYTRTYSDSAASTVASSKWLTLDGESKYVALIIAPGEELESQNRVSGPTDYANYLDGENGPDFDFFTSYASNPELFNDEILGITLDEYMIYVGTAVAREVKLRLDQFYLLNLNGFIPTRYPYHSVAALPDGASGTCYSSTFSNVFDGTTYGDASVWLRDSTAGNNGELWSCRQNMDWTRVSYTEGYLTFSGCPNIRFRITYASPGLTREGDTCL